MSASWNEDDLARLLALEHAFYALALISAGNFAFLAETTTSKAVAQFRQAIEGAVFDTADRSPQVRDLMRKHLHRMFDHIQSMAKEADAGPQ